MFKSIQQFKIQNDRPVPFDSSINQWKTTQNIANPQTSFVSPKAINQLRQFMAKASEGAYFFMQLGGGTEGFYEDDSDTTYENLEFIRQIAAFFQRKTGGGVIQIAEKRRANPSAHHGYNAFQNKDMYSYYRNLNQWNRGLSSEEEIYTSHELSLPYDEQCNYTHLPYLGRDAINSIEHLNYLKKIANPIAIKIGPTTSISSVIKAINILDPDYQDGRIMLIPGLGIHRVQRILPQLIEAVKKTYRKVLWSCDPMYGNIQTLGSGLKIRKLQHIVEEIQSSFLIHKNMGSQLNAMYLEATCQNVTECLGYESTTGGGSVIEFKKKTKTLLDPRLNYAQTLHVIRCVAKQYIGQ